MLSSIKDKRKVVVFDFDGTLTTADTLPLFIRFVFGMRRLLWGIAVNLPWIVLYKLRLYSNSKAKERLFGHFFRRMPYAEFEAWGKRFADVVKSREKASVVERMHDYVKDGSRVVVISASMEEWVRPWCEANGASVVCGTKVEVDGKGFLTGRFASPNCYGAEKVRRLLLVEPQRAMYMLVAYGDSRGDHEMFAEADEAHRV